MTNVANIQAPTPSAPPPQAPAASSPAASASVAALHAPVENDTSISPRIVVDPSAGVIIQFLSSSGIVQNQIPSSTVVAYLRAGLTADGLSKPQNGGAQEA